MITIPPDLSGRSSRQLQQLASSCAQDVAINDGCDYITAWRRAADLCPQVWAALNQLPIKPDNATALPNAADLARIPIASEDNIAKLGLARGATPGEYACCAKACSNKPDTADHEKVMDALVSHIARTRNLSMDDAQFAAASRHPNLARLAATAKATKALQAPLSKTGAGFGQTKNPSQRIMDTPSGATSMAMANSRDTATVALHNSRDIGKQFKIRSVVGANGRMDWDFVA